MNRTTEREAAELQLRHPKWSFWVPGIPRGKGAMSVMRGTMKMRPTNNKVLKVWTAHVKHFAERVEPDPPEEPLAGPWSYFAEYYFLAPKKPRHPHYAIGGMGKQKGVEGSSGPTGDGDHLDRAVWDALTGVFWTDDRIVAHWGGTKLYVHNPDDVGAQIVVQYLGDEGEQLNMTGQTNNET